MKVIWATISRSGSQFLLSLTRSLLGSELQPQSRIHGYRAEGYEDRVPSFKELYKAGRPMDYFIDNRIAALKLEDPGLDDLGYQLLDTFPEARWLTSVRPLDAIVTSHHNVLKWGKDEDYVLKTYRETLGLLQKVHERGGLLAVAIHQPERFSPSTFARFLQAPVTPALERMAGDWKPTNDLAYQKDKWGESFDGTPEVPPGLATLRTRVDWVADAEAAYERLVDESWALHAAPVR